MKITIITSVLFIAFLTSCSVIKTTPRTVETYNSNIIIKPLIAEVEVDVNKKITAEGVNKKANVEAAKEMAKWNAIQVSGADIIVDPVYYIKTTGKTVVVTVTGYYGKYVKIESVKNEDIEKLNTFMESGNAGGSSSGTSIVSKLKKINKK
jgi:hypothetical protein